MNPETLIWIEERDILVLHERLLAVHGGAEGVRDLGLLQSALARAPQRLADLACAYTAGIVKNHPFVDGNKRTGFVAGVLFLELNGGHFTAPEDTAAEAVLALAGGTMDESGYTEFLRNNSQ